MPTRKTGSARFATRILACCVLLGLGACVDGAGPQSGPQGDASGEPGERAAEDALEGFTVASGLEVTLFAGEPMLVNPTNIDIDARGRVWVCEARNYRPAYNHDVDIGCWQPLPMCGTPVLMCYGSAETTTVGVATR
jgi:hypothetical protein